LSALLKLAAAANRMGFGPLVARAASMAYRGSSFAIDGKGRWVNRQPEATFVSPTLHTTRFAAARQWVLDHWTWGYCPKRGDTVIDVGAGIGEETVVFSQLVGEQGRVISIEAHPQTYSCLRKTIELSGLTNVTPLCCALADKDGELFISDAEFHLGNSVIGQSAGTRVPARSFDSLARELGLDDVGLIKMNIEGAEKLAVEGIAATAPNIRNLVISCHDFLVDSYGAGPEMRTKSHVRGKLESEGFSISTRPDAPEPWVRDYLYARGPGA
jgi:FkbM family methyltransferase